MRKDSQTLVPKPMPSARRRRQAKCTYAAGEGGAAVVVVGTQLLGELLRLILQRAALRVDMLVDLDCVVRQVAQGNAKRKARRDLVPWGNGFGDHKVMGAAAHRDVAGEGSDRVGVGRLGVAAMGGRPGSDVGAEVRKSGPVRLPVGASHRAGLLRRSRGRGSTGH